MHALRRCTRNPRNGVGEATAYKLLPASYRATETEAVWAQSWSYVDGVNAAATGLVTQQDLHIDNLTELVEIVEAESRRSRTILACGGSRVSNELAKELGFDAGFSRGTYPVHLASFLVREVAARIKHAEAQRGRALSEEIEPSHADARRTAA